MQLCDVNNDNTFKSKKMRLERSVEVNTSIENAWQILGKDFSDIQKWSRNVGHSKALAPSNNSANCDGRYCEVKGFGNVEEKFLNYSDHNHTYTIDFVKGLPGMAKSFAMEFKLDAIDANRTRFMFSGDLALQGILGFLMQPMMKIQMNKNLDALAEDFVYFAENGTPHPKNK